MKKPVMLTIVVVAAIGLRTTVSALEVLQSGYVVETYARYVCPVSVEAYGMPRGMAFAPDGNLYLTQLRSYPDKGTIHRVSPDGTAVEWLSCFATPRRIVWTGGSAFGNYLYLTDGTSNALFRVSLDGSVSAFAAIGGGVHSLGLDRQGLYGGHLYVATRAPDHVHAVSLSGQVTLFSSFPGNVPSGHLDLTFDPGTNWGQRMYVALERPAGQSGVGGVFSIATNGQATPVATNIVTAWTVAVAPAGPFFGDLYVCGKLHDDDPSYSLWRVKPDGNLIQFAVPTIGSNLHNFTFAPDGTMLVPEFSFAEQTVVISRISAAGGTQIPSLLVEPADQTVFLGQPAQFSVVVQGATPLCYQWQFQGTNLPGATAAWLALAAVQFSDAGGYCLVASNAYGAVTSRVATLTVMGCPPSITRQPASQSDMVGGQARFDAVVDGSPPLWCQWQCNGAAIAGATNNVFLIGSVSPANAGNYRLIVTNAFGSVTSAVAWLIVLPPATAPGSLDPTFNPNVNVFASGGILALALDAAGRVYAGGCFTNLNGVACPGLARLRGDGRWDQTFRLPWSAGWFGACLAMQPDQRLLVLGGTNDWSYRLSRLNSDGTLDGSFPNETLLAKGFVLQPDGRIITFATSSAMRFFSNGSRDWSFSPSLPHNDATVVAELALQPNGGILLCGSSDIGLRRYYPGGNQDDSFNSEGIEWAKLAAQPDSRILVARQGSLGRLNAYGGWDSTFPTVRFLGDVQALAVQPDGCILAAFRRTDRSETVEIYRFNANGTRDESFLTTIAGLSVTSMLIQPDGRILIGGMFWSVNGMAATNLARLNGDYVPVLRALGRPGLSGFPIELTGGPAQRYAVEFSSNLVTWSVAGYVTNSPSGTCCFTNQLHPGAGYRFYRSRR